MARTIERTPVALKAIEARRAAGLTQRQAGALLGLHFSTISFLETGRWSISERRLNEILAAYEGVRAEGLGR